MDLYGAEFNKFIATNFFIILETDDFETPKTLERVVYNQVCKYMSDKSLIYHLQSGFRSGYSTDTALTYLTDKIRFNMDKGLYTGTVIIDLQKAFDTVDHHILLCKLKSIGLDDNCVLWFQSYLCGRKQFVENNGC